MGRPPRAAEGGRRRSRCRCRRKGLGMLRLSSFNYLQPKTLAEAIAMQVDAGPDGAFVAGGTDLYPNMKRRQQEPKVVISLMGLREVAGWEMRDAGWVVGPCVTLSDLSILPSFRQSYPAVAHAAELVSTPLLRNMGTLGGNLCLDTRCNYYDQTYEWRKAIDFCMKKDGHICWVAPSSPRCWAVSSSDVAPVMVALGAEFQLAGPKGERVVPAARLYANDGIDYLTKQPDEILAEVRLPAAEGWDAVYHKLRRRGAFDFPVLGFVARPPARTVHRLDEAPHGAVHVGHRAAERAFHGVVDPLEDVVHHVLVLFQERTSRVGDLVDLLAFHLAGGDEPLVLEQLQRRVHGAGGGCIAATQLVFQLLHDLVAVARLVLEQLEDYVLHVAGLEPLAAPAARPGPKHATGSEPEGERFPSEMARHGLSPSDDVTVRYYGTIYLVNEGGNRPHIGLGRCEAPSKVPLNLSCGGEVVHLPPAG